MRGIPTVYILVIVITALRASDVHSARASKCKFDRDCCKGWECRMSVISHLGVDNYCQRRDWTAPINDSTNSHEDDFWMVAEPWKRNEDGEENAETPNLKYADAVSGIREIQEKKRLDLQRDNEELERLFTEKDEDDLEKLRAIKEDMELDELRALKELRLKRKLQLLKELRELKALQAEETLNTLSTKENETQVAESGVVLTRSSEIKNTPNQTIQLETPNERKEQENNVTSINDSAVDGTQEQNTEQDYESNAKQTITNENIQTKNRQGIRDHHHKRKHQKKHKRKPRINSTDVENSNNPASYVNEYADRNTSDTEKAPT